MIHKHFSDSSEQKGKRIEFPFCRRLNQKENKFEVERTLRKYGK